MLNFEKLAKPMPCNRLLKKQIRKHSPIPRAKMEWGANVRWARKWRPLFKRKIRERAENAKQAWKTQALTLK